MPAFLYPARFRAAWEPHQHHYHHYHALLLAAAATGTHTSTDTELCFAHALTEMPMALRTRGVSSCACPCPCPWLCGRMRCRDFLRHACAVCMVSQCVCLAAARPLLKVVRICLPLCSWATGAGCCSIRFDESSKRLITLLVTSGADEDGHPPTDGGPWCSFSCCFVCSITCAAAP